MCASDRLNPLCDATDRVELPDHVRHRVRLLPVPGGRHVPRVLPAGEAPDGRRGQQTAPVLRHCVLSGSPELAC